MSGSCDVRELRGRLRGETVFVLGNGPSIREHDLHRLHGRRVIGMNASPLLDREFGFESDYYVVSDARFLAHQEKRKLAVDLPSRRTKRVFREELRSVDSHELVPVTYYVRSLGKNGFSEDLWRGFYFGCTTSMLAIQLAYHLGAAKIALLGNDLRYPKGQPRFYHESAPQTQDPFLSIQIWNIRNAFVELRRLGVELCICTRSTNLVPYVPFVPFEELTGG
jgi:hypothetical protein